MNVSIKSYIAFAFLAVSISSYALNEDIKLTVKGYHNEHTRILDNNSVLFSGDSFRLKVEALSNLYIYVFLIDSNNNVQQLQSQNSNSFISKDQSISFPSSNTKDWYRLVGNTGIETLIIVSSPNTLNTAQITNADQLNLLESSKVTLEKFIIKHLSAKLAMRGISDLDNIPDEQLTSKATLPQTISESIGPISNSNDSSSKTIIQIMEDSKNNELINSSKTRGIKEVRIFEDSAPAVVFVETTMGHGTGALVSNDGLIFTNSHVVGEAKKVYIYFMPTNANKYSRKDFLTGMVVNNNKTVDLALIKLTKNPVNVKPLSLADPSSIKIGQDVHAIGHPGNGSQWTYTKGYIGQILNNHEWDYNDGETHKAKTIIQSQTPIFQGNSGGPLLNDNGLIIGVNTYGTGENGYAVNYAVSVRDLDLFLNEKYTIPKAPSKTKETIAASNDWGNNVIRIQKIDFDEDGRLDTLYYLDDDNTGTWEVILIELSSTDELVVIFDWDEDGKWNERVINTNSNPTPDFHIFDEDGDGEADYFGYDDNDDWEVDRYEEA
jgi:S1-C subfamily serine protease